MNLGLMCQCVSFSSRRSSAVAHARRQHLDLDVTSFERRTARTLHHDGAVRVSEFFWAAASRAAKSEPSSWRV